MPNTVIVMQLAEDELAQNARNKIGRELMMSGDILHCGNNYDQLFSARPVAFVGSSGFYCPPGADALRVSRFKDFRNISLVILILR